MPRPAAAAPHARASCAERRRPASRTRREHLAGVSSAGAALVAAGRARAAAAEPPPRVLQGAGQGAEALPGTTLVAEQGVEQAAAALPPPTTLSLLEGDVRYVDVEEGHGDVLGAGSLVVAELTGVVLGEQQPFLDTRSNAGGGPIVFSAGLRPPAVPEGLEAALLAGGFRSGGRRFVTVPPALGYGRQGVDAPLRRVPGNATLLYDVQLLRCRPVGDGLACCNDADAAKCEAATAPNLTFDDSPGLNPGAVWA